MVAGHRVFQAAVFAAQLLTSLGREARLIAIPCIIVFQLLDYLKDNS